MALVLVKESRAQLVEEVGLLDGKGVGVSVSREGGASTFTQPIWPVQMEIPSVQPRVFAMTQQEAASLLDVISGRLTIFGESTYALIDPSATHSFIISSFI